MSLKAEYVNMTKQMHNGYIDVTRSPNENESTPNMTSHEYIDAIKTEFKDHIKIVNQRPKSVEKMPEIIYFTGKDPNLSPQPVAQ